MPGPHRAAKGFLRVTGPGELMFADHGGNRQMISIGSLAVNDRASLLLMDYPARERLKILGHAKVLDARERPGLAAKKSSAGSGRHSDAARSR